MKTSQFRNYIRSASLLVSMIFVVSVAACGLPTRPTSPEEQTLITFAGPEYEHNQYEQLANSFHQDNPDIQIRIISVDEVLGRTGQANIASTDDFGVVARSADTFTWFTPRLTEDWEFVFNLQPLIERDPSFPFDDYYPATLDMLSWNDNVYGLPLSLSPIVMFYDETLFDEAGVSYPEIGWSWDDFLDKAELLTQRVDGKVSRYGFVAPSHLSTDLVLGLLQQSGISLWDESKSIPVFDHPDVAAVVRRYADMALTHEVMPVPNLEADMSDAMISSRTAPMWAGMVFAYTYRAKDAGIVPFPEDVAAANPFTMDGLFVSAGTSHPEAAWRWLLYLSQNYQPFLDGILPARRSVGEKVIERWGSFDSGDKAAILYAVEHPANTSAAKASPLIRAIYDVFWGKETIEDALATAQARALELQESQLDRITKTPFAVTAPHATPAGIEITITFAPAFGQDSSIYNSLAVAFNQENPDVWVNVVPPVYIFSEETAALDCFAGSLPVHIAEARQYLRSLDAFLDAEAGFDRNDFYPAVLATQQNGGQQWGIPYEVDALMVYYNLGELNKAGLKAPFVGWTIDDFLDTASGYTNSTGRYGFTTRDGAYGDLVFVLERLGAKLLDETQFPNPPTFTDLPVVAALNQYAALTRNTTLTPATPSQQSGWPDGRVIGNHPAGVQEGQVLMWVSYLSEYNAAPPIRFDVAAAPLPAGRTMNYSGIPTGEFVPYAYYISAGTKNADVCWQWLSYISGRPATVRLLPARRSIAASPTWENQVRNAMVSAYHATIENFQTSNFAGELGGEWLPYAYPWLYAAYQATLSGTDASQSLAEAQFMADAYFQCLANDEYEYIGTDTLRNCALATDPNWGK